MPNGRLNFTLFKAKPLEGEDAQRVTWIYDVVWNYYDASKKDDSQNNQYLQSPQYDMPQAQNTSAQAVEVDEDEIPF